MRACFVEVGGPGPDHGAGMGHIAEHGLVQEFVAHAPVEAFHEAVLHGLTRRDVMPFDLALRGKG